MKVAFILPSLAQKGPILVVRDIVSVLKDKIERIDVFYFDNIVEIEFDCPVHKININEKINFSDYDIVHSNMLRPDFYVWKNSKYIKHKITTLHCDIRVDLFYYEGLAASLVFRWIWLFMLRRFDAVVVLTKSIMNSYYRHYIRKDKLTYIYNGRALTTDAPPEENDADLINGLKQKHYKIIGANALLTRKKGLHRIISVLPALKDYVFVVLGDGKEKAKLIKQAKKLGVASRCFFLGFKKNAVSYLSLYDVYAMPSVSEGFSLALTEAAMMKCSCVCSDIDLFRELFTEEEVTFFDLKNKKSLQFAIEKAFAEKTLKGENVFQRSAKEYTAEAMADNYLKLYKVLHDRQCSHLQ